MSVTETPRVLVTRPTRQGEKTAGALRKLGYRPVLAPLLKIVSVPSPDLPNLETVQAVLVTSINGAEKFAALTPLRGLRVLTVGERTAEAARALGFDDVASADGDGADLIAMARTLDPDGGAILHVRGTHHAVSFSKLRAEGFDVREAVLYDSVQVTELSGEARAEKIAAALIYSNRTAEALAIALAREKALSAGGLTVLGISETALDPLRQTAARLIAADEPTEASLLDALQQAVPVGRKN